MPFAMERHDRYCIYCKTLFDEKLESEICLCPNCSKVHRMCPKCQIKHLDIQGKLPPVKSVTRKYKGKKKR